MPDYQSLMQILSVPRPNGSPALTQTRRALQDWLTQRSIPHRAHAFRLYPFFFEAIGLWLILSRTLLAFAVWFRWGWAVLPVALIGLLGGLLDVLLHWPLVTWPGARVAENILIEFEPLEPAAQEIVLSAHYDTKTEPLDHRQRMFFLQKLPLGILLSVLLGLLGPLDGWLLAQGSSWASLTFWLSVGLTIPLLILTWGLGLNFSIGRFIQPSHGAVDNGTSCAALLGLAEKLAEDSNALTRTKVTLALFAGEEVNLQGSRAYVNGRDWPLPAIALNLEALAQDGVYLYWEQDGSVFKLVPTSPEVNRILSAAVMEVTDAEAQPAGPVISDGASFLAAGIPTAVMGTFDTQLALTGFHRPTDNLTRAVLPRLPETVKILHHIIEIYDRES